MFMLPSIIINTVLFPSQSVLEYPFSEMFLFCFSKCAVKFSITEDPQRGLQTIVSGL